MGMRYWAMAVDSDFDTTVSAIQKWSTDYRMSFYPKDENALLGDGSEEKSIEIGFAKGWTIAICCSQPGCIPALAKFVSAHLNTTVFLNDEYENAGLFHFSELNGGELRKIFTYNGQENFPVVEKNLGSFDYAHTIKDLVEQNIYRIHPENLKKELSDPTYDHAYDALCKTSPFRGSLADWYEEQFEEGENEAMSFQLEVDERIRLGHSTDLRWDRILAEEVEIAQPAKKAWWKF